MTGETWALVVLGIGMVLRSVWYSMSRRHTSWISTVGFLVMCVCLLASAPPSVVLACAVVFAVGEILHQGGIGILDSNDEVPEDLTGNRRIGQHRRD